MERILKSLPVPWHDSPQRRLLTPQKPVTVDPNGEGVLPQTDDGAAYAGMTRQEMSEHGLDTKWTTWVFKVSEIQGSQILEGLRIGSTARLPLPVGAAIVDSDSSNTIFERGLFSFTTTPYKERRLRSPRTTSIKEKNQGLFEPFGNPRFPFHLFRPHHHLTQN